MRAFSLLIALMAVASVAAAQDQTTLSVQAIFERPEQRCQIQVTRPLRITLDARRETSVEPTSDDAGLISVKGAREATILPARLLILAESDRLPRRVPIKWKPEILRQNQADGTLVRVGGHFRLPPSTPPGLYHAVIELQAFCE